MTIEQFVNNLTSEQYMTLFDIGTGEEFKPTQEESKELEKLNDTELLELLEG